MIQVWLLFPVCKVWDFFQNRGLPEIWAHCLGAYCPGAGPVGISFLDSTVSGFSGNGSKQFLLGELFQRLSASGFGAHVVLLLQDAFSAGFP